MADAVLLLLPGSNERLPAFNTLDAEVGIVAWVHLQLTTIQLDNGAHQPIKQGSVVTHHQNSAPKRLRQEILQPLPTRDVQVVGGFVEQKNIRIFQQQRGQPQSPSFTSGQALHGLMHSVAKANPSQRFVHSMPPCASSQCFNLVFKSTLFGKQGLQFILRSFAHGVKDRFQRRDRFDQWSECSGRRRTHRVAGHKFRILTKESHPRAPAQLNFA